MADVGTLGRFGPGTVFADDMQRCGRATFSVRRLSVKRAAVAVVGDIDFTNGRAFGHYVERHTGISRQLVLDLRAVDFFGGQGFTALYYIAVHCARCDVDWTIVGGHPVRRLLAICDAEGELPLADDLSAALARLDRLAGRHHQATRSSDGSRLRRRHAEKVALT
jgi:anti-anti-sigma factor